MIERPPNRRIWTPESRLVHPSLNQMFGLRHMGLNGGAAISDLARVVSFAAPTSTGLFQITGGFNWKPVAALFFIGSATGTSGQENTARLGYGMTDGTNHWWMAHRSRHNHGASNSYFWSANDNPIGLNEDASLLFEASFSEFIAGGVKLNATTANSAYLGFAVFLPPTWDAYVGTETPDTTAGNSISVTGVGFQPASVLMASCPQGENFSDSRFSSNGGFSFGGYSNSTQRQLSWSEQTGASTTSIGAVLRTDGVCQAVDGFNMTNDAEYQLSNFGSDGFDIDTTNDNASGTTGIGYMALRHPSASISIGTITSPTSTGDQSYTGSSLDVTNGAALFLMSNLPGANTAETDRDGECWSVGAADSGGERSLAFRVDDNNSSATDTSTECRNAAITAGDEDGNEVLKAQKSSTFVVSNGYSLNWTTVDTSARYGVEIVIGE